jgi:hypothetical protein
MAHGKHRRKRFQGKLTGEARKVAQLKDRASQERADRDTIELRFNALACEHPEACSCDADYPGWKPGDR